MIDGLGDHRSDDAQVVDDPGRVRQEIGDPRAAGAVLLEPELRTGERQRRLVAGHARQALALPHRVRQLFAVALVEHRLVVERLHLRRAAGHEQVDDALGPGRHVQRRRRAHRDPGLPASTRAGFRRSARARPPRPRPTRLSSIRRDSPAAGAAPGAATVLVRLRALRFGATHRSTTNSSKLIIALTTAVIACQGSNILRRGGRQRWIRRRVADVHVLHRISGVPREPLALLFEHLRQDAGLGLVGQPADQGAKRVAIAIARILRVPLQDALRERPRRFDELRIVQQHQRLQRRQRRLAPGDAHFAADAVERDHRRRRRGPPPERVQAAAIELRVLCPACRPCRSRIAPTARPADTA